MIDFVILWVDGNDNDWIHNMKKYKIKCNGDSRDVRFRNWDNLHFLFRGIEKYAPWVNKVHFVTEGHLPEWLNTKNPKINIVRHSDIIDKKYLPLFNSRAIELNIYKIKGLSEKFVYFNDDMFITDYLAKNYFFQNDLPKDVFAFNVISPSNDLSHVLINNMKIINKYILKSSILNTKVLNVRYSIKNLIRTICLNAWPSFIGFYDTHQPTPFLKSTFQEIFNKENDLFTETLQSKFKNNSNINQYLFRYYQLASFRFLPQDIKTMKMKAIKTKKDIAEAENFIINNKYKLLCLNDTSELYDFEDAKNKLIKAFEVILPNKSSFEI